MRVKARKIFSLLCLSTFFLIIALGIVSPWYPSVGGIGVIVWYISYGLFFILACSSLVFLWKNLIKKRYILTILAILFFMALVSTHFNDPQSISFETANQTTCVLNHQANAVDRGFNQTCMNGYPARQYLLSSLPSTIFGRSLWTLHLGGSLYFFLGLIIFSCSALKRFTDYKTGDFVVSTILFSMLHFYYFNHFMFIYEQSIFPFSMALIAVGLLLDFEREPSIQTMSFLGLVNLWLIYSYTPGLAVFFLIFFILLCIVVKKNQPHKIRLMILIVLALSLLGFWLSLSVRGDIHIREGTTSVAQLKNDAIAALKHVVWQEQGSPMVSPVLNFLFLLIVFSALLCVFGWQGFIVGFWTVGVLIFSVISKGYWYYPIDFRLHRALIIFPFLFFLIVKKFEAIEFNSKKTRYAAFILMLFIFLSGIAFHQKYIKERKISRNTLLTKWLVDNFPREYVGRQNRILFDTPLAGPIDDSYSSQGDYIAYFMPGSKSEVVDPSCTNLHSEPDNTFLFVTPYEEQKLCYSNLPISLDYINSFSFNNDGPLKFYKVNRR